MNDQTDQQLLRAYTERQSEAAFAAIVHRYVDLVYSTALRLSCDAHAAKDVTQGVFSALAQNAQQLTDRPVLAGWLHGTARNLAVKAIRSDVRRRAREQEAAVMNELLSANPDASWEHIAPFFDDALGELSEPDRDAVLLSYFKNHDLRTVGATLGISDDAAQKRVSRAVERLREFFAKRGVTVGASGLIVVISANAVQAAPVGLALTISTAAVLTGTTLATTATITATKAIAMTAFQKTIVSATIAVLAGAGIYEARQASQLREQVQTLQQQQAPLAEQIQEMQTNFADATNRLAALLAENGRLKTNPREVELLRLRGEVSQLKSDPAASAAKTWLDKVNKLKQRLEATPNAKTPELQLATDQDWFDVARGNLNSDADYRRALSELRRIEASKVATMLRKALKAFMQGNNGRLPTDMAQLQPYLDSPIDNAILQQWEIGSPTDGSSYHLGSEIVITLKAAVDDVFDTRFAVGPDGWGSRDFLSQETMQVMNPLFDAFKAAHNGQWPEHKSQLLPYAATPEQQAAVQKWILKESASGN